MPHNNEQVIDQWVEENGKTRYQEFDGTERKDDTPYLDGGIVGGLLDNADRDHQAFLTDKISDELYEAAANALENLNISLTAAKEVAADAIAKAVTECKTLYDFYEYDDLAKYNLDAAIIDWQLFGKKKVTP